MALEGHLIRNNVKRKKSPGERPTKIMNNPLMMELVIVRIIHIEVRVIAEEAEAEA